MDQEREIRQLQERGVALGNTIKDMISFIQESTDKAAKSLRVRGGALFLDGDEDERVRAYSRGWD